MTTVKVVEPIAANAGDVWKILSDFGGIKVGGPIEAFEIEGEGVGAVRTITTGGGNSKGIAGTPYRAGPQRFV